MPRLTRVTLLLLTTTALALFAADIFSPHRGGVARPAGRLISDPEIGPATDATRARRAAAPPAVRRALDAPVHAPVTLDLSLADALRHISRVYHIPIDADWANLPRGPGQHYVSVDTDVGGLLEYLLANPRYGIDLTYHVVNDRIVIVPNKPAGAP